MSADEHDDAPDALIVVPAGDAEWLADVKARVHAAQQRAALAVNAEVMQLYWQLGRDILDQQGREGWGAKVTDRLAHDLKAAFPEVKGFSPRNLKYMRRFAEAWPDREFVQQLLHKLPWFHLCTLLDKLKDPAERRLVSARIHPIRLVPQRARHADRDQARIGRAERIAE